MGDTLTVSYTFTTPATGGSGEDFRVGLFNTGGVTGFEENISASSGTPNPILNNLPGFSGEFDINTDDADLALRTHDVNSVNGTGPTGRLLTTTDGFDFRRERGRQWLCDILAGTTVHRHPEHHADDSPDSAVVTQTLLSASVNETFTSNSILIADAGEDAGFNTTTFDFLGFSVTSGAFGSVNNVGEADNGLDFNNVSVTFTAVPEPASLALLAIGATALVGRRRKA